MEFHRCSICNNIKLLEPQRYWVEDEQKVQCNIVYVSGTCLGVYNRIRLEVTSVPGSVSIET